MSNTYVMLTSHIIGYRIADQLLECQCNLLILLLTKVISKSQMMIDMSIPYCLLPLLEVVLQSFRTCLLVYRLICNNAYDILHLKFKKINIYYISFDINYIRKLRRTICNMSIPYCLLPLLEVVLQSFRTCQLVYRLICNNASDILHIICNIVSILMNNRYYITHVS